MQQWANQLRSQVARFQERSLTPGMAVGVAEQGQVLLAEGFGHRDLERALPATADTVFGVASVTKSFTALAVMQLQDEGRLSVHDPVTRWLPAFTGPNPDWVRGMTIHHLLTHSSGLPGMQALFHARAGSIAADPNRSRLGLVANPAQIRLITTYVELIELMAETDYELLGPPGTWFNYSNEGYALLQGVVERAADQPFLERVQERILDPLRMSRSAFRTADLARLEPVTELYAMEAVDGRPVVFHAPGWWDVGAIYSNGSLKSTVADLLRYLELYRTGGVADGVRLLSEAALAQMTAPQVALPAGGWYGYGWNVWPDVAGTKVISHGGAIKGVSAHVMVAPEAGVTAAVLCNLSGVSPELLTWPVLASRLGRGWTSPKESYPAYEPAPLEVADWVGLYRNAEGISVRVAAAEGGLTVVSGGLPFAARLYGPDRAVLVETNSPLRLLRDGAGRVTGLFQGVRVLPVVR